MLPSLTLAGEVSVAVASNFAAPMKLIAQAFERDTGHQARLSFGATGQFYAQISHGAPFAVLLAADDQVPAKLQAQGKAVPGTLFTYAVGRLVLWSRTPGVVDEHGEVLRHGKFDRIAIANPKLAPYGVAALEVLKALELAGKLAPKLVEGSNIGQTFQFVASGNATLGFVALSQVYGDGRIKTGSGWIVPVNLYRPIKQDAILLNPGKDIAAAAALLSYLRGDTARSIIQSFGYGP